MVAIEGENMRQVTWVVVKEVHSGDWGIAGLLLSTANVKALAAARRGLLTPPAALLASGREKARRGRALGRCPRPALDLIDAALATDGTEQLEWLSGQGHGWLPRALYPLGSPARSRKAGQAGLVEPLAQPAGVDSQAQSGRGGVSVAWQADGAAHVMEMDRQVGHWR